MKRQLITIGLAFISATLFAAEIPFINLADEKYRQTVVDREKGQYLGHVTTCLLDDKKTILAVYPKGHGRGALRSSHRVR